jgi:hypothetical protein
MRSGRSVPGRPRSTQPRRSPNEGAAKVLFCLAVRVACRVNRHATAPPTVIAVIGLASSRFLLSHYAGFFPMHQRIALAMPDPRHDLDHNKALTAHKCAGIPATSTRQIRRFKLWSAGLLERRSVDRFGAVSSTKKIFPGNRRGTENKLARQTWPLPARLNPAVDQALRP